MSRIERDRRRFLAAGGTGLAMAVAGCSSVVINRIGGGGGHDDEEEEEDGGGIERAEDVPEAVHEYLIDNDGNLYEGEAVDATGESEVTIANGASDGEGGNVAFDPPAIRVDAGTTVTWEWTGEGGAHNVVSADASATEFRSGDTVNEAGHTWSQEFEEAGNQLYFCNPHQAVGMYGAVIVE